MGKSFINPFAVNPEMKFGVSPDPSIIRPETGMQENRAGVQRVPQRPYVYQGGQGSQTASNQKYAANRGYRVPAPAGTSRAGITPAGTAPSGAVRAASTPAAPAQANMPQPANDKSAKVFVESQDKAESAVQAKAPINTRPRVGNKTGINMTDGLRLDFSGDNLMRGFVMSEVLGRPKCFSRGRW